jgi:hypothetical protein
MAQRLTPEIIVAAIAGFEAQKTAIDCQIAELRSILDGRRSEPADSTVTARPRKKRSAAVKRRMALAQRARYAKLKQGSESTRRVTSKPKRKVSRAARAKMAAAQKARWAKIKASQPQLAVAKKGAAKKAA